MCAMRFALAWAFFCFCVTSLWELAGAVRGQEKQGRSTIEREAAPQHDCIEGKLAEPLSAAFSQLELRNTRRLQRGGTRRASGRKARRKAKRATQRRLAAVQSRTGPWLAGGSLLQAPKIEKVANDTDGTTTADTETEGTPGPEDETETAKTPMTAGERKAEIWLETGWLLMFITILLCLYVRFRLADLCRAPLRAKELKQLKENMETIEGDEEGSGRVRVGKFMNRLADLLHGDGWVGTCLNTWIVILALLNWYSYSVLTEADYYMEHDGKETLNDFRWPAWLNTNATRCNSRIELISMIVFTIITLARLSVVPFLPEWSGVPVWAIYPRYIVSNLYIGLEILALCVSYHGVAEWTKELAGRAHHNNLNLLWLFIVRTFEMWERSGHGLGARQLQDMIGEYGGLLLSSFVFGLVVWVLLSGMYYVTMKNGGGDGSTWEAMKFGGEDWNKFESIPSTMWFCLINLLKEHPLADAFVTFPQRTCIVFSCILGVPLFAIPLSIMQCAILELEDSEEPDDKHEPEVQDYMQAVASVALVLVSCVSYFYYTARDQDYGIIFGMEWTRVTEEAFLGIDAFIAVVFCVEWFIRLIIGQVEYLFSSLGLIDFISWVPGFVHIGMYYTGAAVDRLGPLTLYDWMCAASVLRILKLERVFGSFHDIFSIVRERKDILATTGLCCFLVWLFFSEMLYWTERDNPDEEMRETYGSNMRSLWAEVINLHGEWPWCDYTAAGKAVGACIGFFSIMIFCIPTAIFSDGLLDRINRDRDPEAELGWMRPHWQRLWKTDVEGMRSKCYDMFYEHMYKKPNQLSWTFKIVRAISLSLWFLHIVTTVASTLQKSMICGVEVGEGKEFATDRAVTCQAYTNFTTTFLVLDYICIMWFSFEYLCRNIALGFNYAFSLIGVCDLISLGITGMCLKPQYRTDAFHPTFTGFAWSSPKQLLLNLKDDVAVPARLLRIFVAESYFGALKGLRDVVGMNRRPITRALYAVVAFWFIHATLLYMFENPRAIMQEATAGVPGALKELKHEKELGFDVAAAGDDTAQDTGENDGEEDDMAMSERYVSVLRALQYSVLHIFGDFPETDYKFPSKCVHVVGILAGIGLMGAFIGVFVGAFTAYYQKRRAEQMRHMAMDRFNTVVWIASAMQRSYRDLKAGRRQPLPRIPLSPFRKWCRSIHCETTKLGYGMNRFFEVCLVLALLNTMINTLPFFDETEGQKYGRMTLAVELVFTAVFMVEYMINAVAVPSRLKSYVRTIDLICLMPGCVLAFNEAVFGERRPTFELLAEAFCMVRALRVMDFRIFRGDMNFIFKAMRNAAPLLAEPGYLAFCVWIYSSTLFWWSENTFTRNPDLKGADKAYTDDQLHTTKEQMTSVPSAMYWCCIYLIGEWANCDFTYTGSRISIFYVLVGITIFGMPVGILAEEIKSMLILRAEEEKFVQQILKGSQQDIEAEAKRMKVRASVAAFSHQKGPAAAFAGMDIGSSGSLHGAAGASGTAAGRTQSAAPGQSFGAAST